MNKEKLAEALLLSQNNERFAYEMLGFWCYLNDTKNIEQAKKCLDIFISQRMELEKLNSEFSIFRGNL